MDLDLAIQNSLKGGIMKNAMHSVVSNYGRTYELHTITKQGAETGFPISQSVSMLNNPITTITPLSYSSETVDRLGAEGHAKISNGMNILLAGNPKTGFEAELVKNASHLGGNAWTPATINNSNFDTLGNRVSNPLTSSIGNLNHNPSVNMNGVKLHKTRRF
ncbi:MAG: hypothetical protein HN820_03120 [Candidatus Marinimicrobia bacterium]|jgi:hypothetical protein|nr:hypothetical protein [Candidatus Neomarinimicrobiota bacterium]